MMGIAFTNAVMAENLLLLGHIDYDKARHT